jgi:hypothetical protein
MWRCAFVSVTILALVGVEAAPAADREKTPDVSVVPKVVRTIPVPNNNQPAWSTRWVDMPTVRDSQAGGELVGQAAAEAKAVPGQVADIKEAAAPPPTGTHTAPVKVLAAVGGALISVAIVLIIYVIHHRPVRLQAPRLEPPGPLDLPPWIGQRNRGSARPDCPSVEAFDREIRNIVVVSHGNGGSAAPVKPAFDPYA